MTNAAHAPTADRLGAAKPKLLFFFASESGRCRRTEAHIAQVLQRRRNHETFDLVRIPVDRRPDLAERFRVERVPAILVVDERRVRARLAEPRGCREIQALLQPWLN
ncbi:MAG TPA: thioredoxin family protein [Gaiellaceae bacterium]|jgi:thioredoxin-like negative regulator of GroEL|nr:thioredoxin family protein [Gaiellaceae bacterium]